MWLGEGVEEVVVRVWVRFKEKALSHVPRSGTRDYYVVSHVPLCGTQERLGLGLEGLGLTLTQKIIIK